MTSQRACEACGADLPADGAACMGCGQVACWDCGTANSIDQAFCRRCGVWLVSQESARTMASYTRLGSTTAAATAAQAAATAQAAAPSPVDGPWRTRPIGSVPLRLGPAPRGRGRWAALSLAVLIAAGALASAVALELRRPQETAAVAAASGVGSFMEPDDPAAARPATVAPTQPAATDVPATAAAGAFLPGASAAASPTVAVEEAAPVDAADAIAAGSAARPDAPGPARSRSGWVCGDSVRLTDAEARRWTVHRVSFLAMDGFERVILHLKEGGPASVTASALGAPMAASSVRGAGGSTSRSTVRRGIGVELSGGIRTGLQLRGFRPKGLRTVRDLSLYRAGPTSRLLIGLASGSCFRMKALPWQPGAAGAAADRQLIIDVRG